MGIKARSYLKDEKNALGILREALGNPRLSVFRSSKNIYAQIIDGKRNYYCFSVITRERSKIQWYQYEGASKIGTLIGDRAIKKG